MISCVFINSSLIPFDYDFDRGYFTACEDMMSWLNTLEGTTLNKTDVYKKLMELRPNDISD